MADRSIPRNPPSKLRKVYRYYRHLAADPEVRQAAKSLAVLGVLGAGLWKLPNLRAAAVKKWRSGAKHGTTLRHHLVGMAFASRATRRAHIAKLTTTPEVRKTIRLGKRAEHLSKVMGVPVERKYLRERLRELHQTPLPKNFLRRSNLPRNWKLSEGIKFATRLPKDWTRKVRMP